MYKNHKFIYMLFVDSSFCAPIFGKQLFQQRIFSSSSFSFSSFFFSFTLPSSSPSFSSRHSHSPSFLLSLLSSSSLILLLFPLILLLLHFSSFTCSSFFYPSLSYSSFCYSPSSPVSPLIIFLLMLLFILFSFSYYSPSSVWRVLLRFINLKKIKPTKLTLNLFLDISVTVSGPSNQHRTVQIKNVSMQYKFCITIDKYLNSTMH